MRHKLLLATLLLSVVACGNGGSHVATEGGERDGGTAGHDAVPAPPPRRVEHPVYSLIDNRLLAHHQRDGDLLIPAGSGGLTKYLRFGVPKLRWKMTAERDGVRVGLPERLAALEVPLTPEQVRAATTLSIRLFTAVSDRVVVKLNGRPASEGRGHIVELQAGWQTVRVPVAADRWVAGPNLIALQFGKSGAAVEWIQVGGEPTDAPLPAIYDVAADALTLPDGYGLAYYVQVPEQGELVADVVGDGCRIDARAVVHDGRKVTGSLSGSNAGLPLEELSGQVARLELTARGCPLARLPYAALTIPGPAPVAKAGPPPEHVVLWVMDTVRGDKIRFATPGARPETPTFDALTTSGAGFSQYYVQGNESQTSHASVWTSLYPINHHVITAGDNWNYKLSKKFDTLPTILRAAGLHTVGATANGTILVWSGYARGFDFWRNLIHDGTGRRNHGELPAGLIYETGIEALGDGYRDPFLLFIGTIDNHKPWIGHEPWLSQYDPEPYRGPFERKATGESLHIPPHTMQCPWTPGERDMKRLFAIYDSDISYQDHVIGELVDQLAEWGIDDRTLLIVTADHGEELWEYPHRCGHGSSSRESLVRVPLIIHYPARIPGGVISEGVDGVDILPTILDLMGLPPLDVAQGESLVPLTQGVGRGYVRPSYSTRHELSHTMRLGVWKATVGREGVPWLYDVSHDPDERENLAGARPLELQMLTDAFSTFLIHRAEWKKRYWGVASNMTARAARELDGKRYLEPVAAAPKTR